MSSFFTENTLCICSKCGRLLLLDPDFWRKFNSPQNLKDFQINSNLNKSPKIIAPLLTYNSPNSCRFEIIISHAKLDKNQKKSLKLVDSQFFYFLGLNFPICDNCYLSTISQMSYYKRFLKQQIHLFNFLLTIPPDVLKFTIETKIRSLSYSSSKGTNLLSSNGESTSISIPLQCDFQYSSITSLPKIPRGTFSEKPRCSPIFLPSVFQITSQNHYGVINGVRIGFYEYNPNSFMENNLALFFLGQLLIHLNTIFNIVPKHLITIKENCCKISGYSLILNSFLPRDVILLNQSMDYFMEDIDQLFCSEECLSVATTPPFLVDFSSHTIGDSYYRFDRGCPLKWSNAMKKLLYDLKLIEFGALKSYINSNFE